MPATRLLEVLFYHITWRVSVPILAPHRQTQTTSVKASRLAVLLGLDLVFVATPRGCEELVEVPVCHHAPAAVLVVGLVIGGTAASTVAARIRTALHITAPTTAVLVVALALLALGRCSTSTPSLALSQVESG